MVSCTSPTPGGGASSNQRFCELWDDVEAEPPAADKAVMVKDDLVAMADDTTVTGSKCTDQGAKIDMDGAVLAEGEEVPSEQGDASSEPVPAVTGEEIGTGAPVLQNLQVTALSAEIGSYGIRVRGNVAVRLSGATSTIGFVGTFSNLDNWSVSLSSSSFTVPGITTSPATFAGALVMRNGVPTLTLSATVSSAKIGDVAVNGARIDVVANSATGVDATVSGTIKVGPSTASGVVNVSFDRSGRLVYAKADIAAHLVGTQAGGKKIDLQGTLKLEGNASETTASFSASGIVGDLVVNEANGSLTLATNKATFVGVLDVQQGANYVRFNGSIVWDGITAYTPFLTLEAGGEYSGTLQDGQTVTAAGTMSTTIVGGQLRSVVTGNFKVGTLKASGSAIVEMNGPTTTLTLDADLVDAGYDARIEGAVIITDGRAEVVNLDAVVNGEVDLGDVTLTGAALSIRSLYGSPLDVSFSGGLKVGTRADLTGSVKASIGPNGSLLSLDGQMSGSLLLDSWGVMNFSGSVVASPEQVALTGSGTVTTINFPLGISFNGTFTSSLTSPSWSLNGNGRFRIASIDVATARISLSQQAGMKATRVGFYFSLIGIPFYFEADFYMKPMGGCDHAVLTGGSFLMRPLLRTVLPDAINCPVT
jgi:hypothetical protein